MKQLLIHIIWLMGAINLLAQSDSARTSPTFWAVNKGTSIGIGIASVYDTYLSPLAYTGKSFALMHERNSRKRTWNGRLLKQQIFLMNGTYTKNPAGNATMYSIEGMYRLGFHVATYQYQKLRLRGGASWNLSGGAVYNSRNSNNPASVRASTEFSLSGIALLNVRNTVLRWQIDLPIVGAFFMPEYGESYYEIGLGNHKGLAHFASLHNRRAIFSNLSADIPVSDWTVRLSLLSHLKQTRANSLHTHHYTHTFMIGLVSESVNLSGHKLHKTPSFKSVLLE